MMKDLFKKSLLAAGVAMMLTGCGTTEAESQEAALETQQQELLAACTDTTELEEVAEHACSHAVYGPFQSVTASPLGTVSFVDVSLPHTAYVVTLPAKTNGCGYGGAVMFTAEESGEYAFLLSRVRGLRIFQGDVEITRECRYSIPSEICSDLRTAIIADLEAGQDYRLEFESITAANAQFTLLVEEAGHHHE
ncbi:hypothetical protein JQX13_29715 [Archangium violaceum]|uniref:hypothetical protein n=1 Tax=Archangium violaceum TaxID=83451 RepID=UPI00193BB2FF|nr:hypothetical protein [Archangium violaceum]QRK04427.1 hypothetical protein JQX13_29715 [Archangium violaceum]